MTPMTSIPPLALALVGAVCLVLLVWNRRWLELAVVFLIGCALAFYLGRGRRGPDRIGRLVAEGVNADRSISLHVQVEPGTPAWYTSAFSVKHPTAGEPAKDSADWHVDLYPTERSDAKPLNADAAGKAVVTLPAPLIESAPNRAVHIWFNGNDNGTTRLDPHAEDAELKPHAESAESAELESHAESAEDAEDEGEPQVLSFAEDWSPEEVRRAFWTNRNLDLACFTYFPFEIRSVEVSRVPGMHPEKNWLVTLADGVRVRVHSPAKTFGLSAAELPGKRFGFRFKDFEKGDTFNGENWPDPPPGGVYAGELDVRPLVPAAKTNDVLRILERGPGAGGGDLTRAACKELDDALGPAFRHFGSGIDHCYWFFDDGSVFSMVRGFPDTAALRTAVLSFAEK